ncbi:hypothetical protein B0H19DRAFT_1223853 [Mycena capillaripes]|nr:hypothetical protein B0H19DRAFT_1223853 [Mycena capillaripes]
MSADLLPPPGGAEFVEKNAGEGKSDSKSHPTRSDSSSTHISGTTDSEAKPPASKALDWLKWPKSLQWVLDNLTWPKVKPTIRSAIAAWISMVLFLIPKIEVFLGQASFLILITSFMSPPSDPFMAVLEREFMILSFVTTAWAWSCLGIKLADLARVIHNPNASFLDAVTGQYLEVAPTVIFGLFIFLGSTVLLYVKARSVPSQIFACLLGCLYISLTTAALFPYPFYQECTGRAVVLPIAFHSAIALLTSILIFPSTISSQFTTRLTLVLAPLAKSFELHQAVLRKDPYSSEFSATVAAIVTSVAKSEAGLAPLAGSARLLPSDLIYSRFPPADFIALQTVAKRMAVRANGMARYFTLLDPMKEKFPVTPLPSRGGTPIPGSPVIPRPPSPPRTPIREHTEDMDDDNSPSTPTRRTRHTHHHSHHHSLLHGLHLSLSSKRNEHVVGVFESHRYLDLEAHLNHPELEAHTRETTALLSQSCTPLLKSCQDSLVWIQDWLGFVRRGTLARWIGGSKQQRSLEERMGELEAVRGNLRAVLDEFRKDKRHLILEPWRPSFDQEHESEQEMPPHRHLFHCYVYQFHLIQVSSNVVTMLDTIHTMETERKEQRLWTPAHKLFSDWSNWHLSEFNEDEEDPDMIQGFPPAVEEYDLGSARRRDPDALPPRNRFEWTMNLLYRGFAQLGRGNTLFAIKAAALTVIMCLPSFLKSSAAFAYENRFIWAIFMGQSTLARFRGDTAFGLSSRVLSTFLGGLLGMVMWYISSGSGTGSAYGLAALCAVCYPFFFYGRIYWPGPPMRMMVFFITGILVIGYSYQDHNILTPSNPGFGWEVAWRRFILVTVGVVAAGVFSLLPPSTTIRRYERMTMATTASEIGTMYCDIISYASAGDMEPQEIVTGLIAIRSKILRSITLKTNAIYEFSMRGRWPAKRYQKIMELQLQLAYSLSHLMSVVEHMESSWTRAFLRRTRFLDADFQGDVLAVISMISTALRTGCALPQITPCPLIDRFQSQFGLHVIHKDSEEDYGLPRTLTLETLQNEQYLMFCVGIATTYGFLARLDRLMVTVKEIVGEQYHIHGAGVSLATKIASRSGTDAVGEKNERTHLPLISKIKEELSEITTCRSDELHPGVNVASFRIKIKIQRRESLRPRCEPTKKRSSTRCKTPARTISNDFQQGRWCFETIVRLLFFIHVFVAGVGDVKIVSSEMDQLWEGGDKVDQVWEILEFKIMYRESADGSERSSE